ncbi:HlyD family secretion protein [Cupriavidus pauculus]|uniref:EmrA/EmrK family multidrug efflux transporter periplasmic adaptor subunit n=1 Tax=Cupriavidus pauculus TaxID=82633 RepID=A0A2N5CE71_9BURK|nr:EmrA/EmrK family multidrug efflux transporter periplasmic adaptor subunit [Cupriavidus pauculus]
MNTLATPAAPAAPAPSAEMRPVPRRRLITVAVLVAVTGIGAGAYWWTIGRHYASTDDAYVAGNVVQVTSLVPGTVVSIAADDTQRVTMGQPLLGLDPTDSEVALQQAAAQLAEAVRQVRTLYVNNGALQANIAQRQANVENARDDLRRRMSVDGTGAVSKEDVDHARSALKEAQAALRAAQEQLASNLALTHNTTVAQHPDVARAAASYRAAYLAHARSTLPAPVTGFVARRAVQVGQRVAPGVPLMGVVPLDQVWVDANFKENQMQDMRVGQPVSLVADFYGGQVRYDGKVAGFAAGTGAAFSVLPAQNATGNWIKVVQRLPVRITLDPAQLAAHPLRIGLSMRATVDVHQHDGASLNTLPAVTPLSTDVYASIGRDADASIARIIAANAG